MKKQGFLIYSIQEQSPILVNQNYYHDYLPLKNKNYFSLNTALNQLLFDHRRGLNSIKTVRISSLPSHMSIEDPNKPSSDIEAYV